jgi:hypothetical protein
MISGWDEAENQQNHGTSTSTNNLMDITRTDLILFDQPNQPRRTWFSINTPCSQIIQTAMQESECARLCKSKEGIIQLGEATSATDTSSIPSPSIDVPPLLVARQLDAIFHMSRFLQGPWIPWMGATHKTSWPSWAHLPKPTESHHVYTSKLRHPFNQKQTKHIESRSRKIVHDATRFLPLQHRPMHIMHQLRSRTHLSNTHNLSSIAHHRSISQAWRSPHWVPDKPMMSMVQSLKHNVFHTKNRCQEMGCGPGPRL